MLVACRRKFVSIDRRVVRIPALEGRGYSHGVSLGFDWDMLTIRLRPGY
jgi:hypothetical protein